MNFSLFSSKNRIINLVITDHSIRYIELKHTNPLTVHKWGERYIPNGMISNGKIIDFETLSSILEQCITEWKLQKRSVRFLVPNQFVIIRKISIPVDIPKDEIRGYLYLEIGSTIHLPFDEPVFDFVLLPEANEKQEVLLFAAKEENVMEYADLLTSVKLKPIAADLSPLALYRLYHRLHSVDTNEHLLMVEFDLSMVNITIFDDHIPFFMHHVPVPYDEEQWQVDLDQSGKQELQFNGEAADLLAQLEDTYKEISKLMDFYRYSLHQGKQSVTKILLNGDHPLRSQIVDEMTKRFDTPIETIQAYDFSNGKEDKIPSTHYLALGLALKEV